MASQSDPCGRRSRGELKATCGLASLARVRKFVKDFCRREAAAGRGEESLAGLELAVNEAAAQVMNGAYGGEPDRRIRIEAEADLSEVTFTLRHFGRPVPLETVQPAASCGSGGSWLALLGIQSAVDEMTCTRDLGGENHIRLTKLRKAPLRSSPLQGS